MFIESATPGPSSSSVRFRADRVVAIRGAPYATNSPWCELLFLGACEGIVVAESPDTIADRIQEVIEAQRRAG